jgi:hypothetical protein
MNEWSEQKQCFLNELIEMFFLFYQQLFFFLKDYAIFIKILEQQTFNYLISNNGKGEKGAYLR